MYAVIVSGGKQHRVEEGEVLKLEKLEVATGESIEFDQVLMVGEGADVKIGAPVVEGSSVSAEVVSHGRHEKIKIVKFNRRKHYRNETLGWLRAVYRLESWLVKGPTWVVDALPWGHCPVVATSSSPLVRSA